MRVPTGLQALVDEGMVDHVLGQLQSGKEAFVYVVECGDEVRCAKVYKDSDRRSFRTATDYREGRRSRGSRDARAAGRRSRHGREVRVPVPHGVHDGVLLMELVCDESGEPAPRIGEVDITRAQALLWHDFMIRQIVRMLCAGVIHGDLSEYNVLLDADGPVIIDLPQAVNASGNNNAFRLLARDVDNMRTTFSRAAPELAETQFAVEIWDLYEGGELQPDTVLTGRHSRVEEAADVDAVLDQIDEARREAEARELGRMTVS